MQSINFRTAHGNLTEVLKNVEAGEKVEITRKGREPAVIVNKVTFEAYKKAALDAEFASLFDTLDSTNKELVNR
ncbi:type II toxin-antitoxin system prevent-host-death family antitoxin [Escherichia sp. E13S3]|uniref:type II toxin-antitoxin system Phd/YefM family antitoxin n=1 Tax=Escherichia sp. E13S3 TaxID=2484854 RepID=UPI0010297239|nr:type II toxin-antitoxin system prevent-host-death family antitoxin [Escherichia sp. E13S3]RZN44935.1 type II toxin-antitoxin system prevent-host-death family antitoxin [Escherichia sp. E13S3]